MNFQTSAKTHVGLLRSNNEDCFTLLRNGSIDGILAAVADGMGGGPAGEVASGIACESLKAFEAATMNDMASGSGISFVQTLIEKTNREIYRNAQESPDRMGMGTTLSVLILWNDHALVGHVGDSRIYRLRDGKLERITVDHTLVQEWVDVGSISPEEAFGHPRGHILTAAVGMDKELDRICTRNEAILREDRFLLCSDGLTDLVRDSEIRDILLSSPDHEACERLVEKALERSGKDNVTVVLVRAE